MPSQYPFRRTIRNDYLGVSKVIRAMTRNELEWLVEAQLAKWRDQEDRKRQQLQKQAERQSAQRQAANLKWQAEEETKATQQKIESFRRILAGSLHTNLSLDWEQLLDRRAYPRANAS
jgi:restriction system protein